VYFEIVIGQCLCDYFAQPLTNVFLTWHEYHSDRVLVGKAVNLLFEKSVRPLDHDPGAVAGIVFGSRSPAMLEILQQV
jgi:hypothetical protein